MILKIARRLDPVIAKFLPTSKAEMDRWIKLWKEDVPFESVAVAEKSVEGLEMNARCLSYTMEHPNEPLAMIVKQQISQGTVVRPVPMYLQPVTQQSYLAEETEDCPSNKSPCFQSNNLPFELCPLSLPVWLTPEEGDEPNVEYRWSTDHPHNALSHGMTADQVLKVSFALYSRELKKIEFYRRVLG